MISRLLFSIFLLISLAATLQADDILFRKKQQFLSHLKTASLKTKFPKRDHDIVAKGNKIRVNKTGRYLVSISTNIKNPNNTVIEFASVALRTLSRPPPEQDLRVIVAFSLKPGETKHESGHFSIPIFLEKGEILGIENRSLTLHISDKGEVFTKHPAITLVPVGKGNALEVRFERVAD